MSSTHHVQPTFYTLQEAVAEGYGAYSTLRSWIAQGKLPAYKTGSRIKVLRADLDALVTPVKPVGGDPVGVAIDTRVEPVKSAGGDPVDVAIDTLVAAAPPLTPEQTRRLCDLLGGAR